MSVSVEFINGQWKVTSLTTGRFIVADELVADLEFVRGQFGRGTVLLAHGVTEEVLSVTPRSEWRTFGIAAVPRYGIPPAQGARRYRCTPGGTIEPFHHNARF